MAAQGKGSTGSLPKAPATGRRARSIELANSLASAATGGRYAEKCALTAVLRHRQAFGFSMCRKHDVNCEDLRWRDGVLSDHHLLSNTARVASSAWVPTRRSMLTLEC